MTKYDPSDEWNDGNHAVDTNLHAFANALRSNVSLADQVLAELDETPSHASKAKPTTTRIQSSWFGELSMFQKIGFSSLSASVLMLTVLWLTTGGASTSFAQVVKNLTQATSYSLDVEFAFTMDGKAAEAISRGRMYWQAPDSTRIENKFTLLSRKLVFDSRQNVLASP